MESNESDFFNIFFQLVFLERERKVFFSIFLNFFERNLNNHKKSYLILLSKINKKEPNTQERRTKNGKSGWNKENGGKWEGQESEMINPIKRVKSLMGNNSQRRTNMANNNLVKAIPKKVKIHLITSSVFLGYNQIRCLKGLDNVLGKVIFLIFKKSVLT